MGSLELLRHQDQLEICTTHLYRLPIPTSAWIVTPKAGEFYTTLWVRLYTAADDNSVRFRIRITDADSLQPIADIPSYEKAFDIWGSLDGEVIPYGMVHRDEQSMFIKLSSSEESRIPEILDTGRRC